MPDTRYKIVYDDNFNELENKVNEKLKDGWRLYKQPFSRECQKFTWICQAMIKD